MNADSLFLAAIDELGSRLVSGSEYDAMRAGGLLRLLLTDADPLVHRVNRSRRLPLVFGVVDSLGEVTAVPGFGDVAKDMEVVFLPGLDIWPGPPDARAEVEVVGFNLERFLGFEMGLLNGLPATVKDLIRFAAHIGGGVHAGPVTNDADEMLSTIDAWVPVNPDEAFADLHLSLRRCWGLQR